MEKANLTERDLSAVAVTIGPGLSLCLRGNLQDSPLGFKPKLSVCFVLLQTHLFYLFISTVKQICKIYVSMLMFARIWFLG